MRARLGLMALWSALLVWMFGASVQLPGDEATRPMALATQGLASPAQVDSQVDPQADLERASAWPQESAEAWQAPSQASPHELASEPSPEEEAALYIAGR
jgi:hypothetical protein